MRKTSTLENDLAFQIRVAGLPVPRREFVFCPWRKYRADFAWPEEKLLVEAEGGIFAKGKGWHMSVGGYLDDMEKYNLAALMGFRVLRFSRKEIDSGNALSQIEQALNGGIEYPEQKELIS